MATPAEASRQRAGGSEELTAITGVVLAISAASGGMLAVMTWASGSAAPVAVLTLILVGALARHAPSLSAWCAAGVWLAVAPLAHGLAIIAPLLMIGLCVALAVGPERLLGWFGDQWSGRTPPANGVPRAWIEDDPNFR